MGTTVEKLNKVLETKEAIRTAINNKGGTLTESDTFSSYANAIESIQTGGGDNKLAKLVDNTITTVTADDLAGVTEIRSYAFYSCSSLTSITIPDSVKAMRSFALHIGSSTNKATITMKSTFPPTIESNTFDTRKLNKIIVPVGRRNAYIIATNWSNFADYIEEATA